MYLYGYIYFYSKLIESIFGHVLLLFYTLKASAPSRPDKATNKQIYQNITFTQPW